MKKLPNLGPKSEQMLLAAGIESLEEVCRLGAVRTYLMVALTDTKPSLNLLWAIYAGLEGKDWRDVSTEEKAAMLRELEDIKRLDEASSK